MAGEARDRNSQAMPPAALARGRARPALPRALSPRDLAGKARQPAALARGLAGLARP